MFLTYHLFANFLTVEVNVKKITILGSGRMTDASLAADIIVSTLFFILTMYGSIMGGSGEVKVTADIDLNKAVGGPAPAEEGKEGAAPVAAQPLKKELI